MTPTPMTLRCNLSRFSVLWLTTGLALCLSATGCAGLFKQAPVAKAYFTIDPGQPAAQANDPPATRPHSPVLRVRALRVSPPYDSLLFVYRTGPSQFDTDYYNNFIAPPASLLTGDLIDWLSRSAPMIVSDTSSDLQPNAVLEGNITRLYIDSSSSPAKAVIAARFFLTRDRNGVVELLWDKTYEISRPVTTKSAADFAKGWGQAYREMLTQLTKDLTHTLAARRQ